MTRLAKGLCADMEPGPWDVDADAADHRRAKAICAGCGVAPQCREFAQQQYLCGVWGGELFPLRLIPISWAPGHPGVCSEAGTVWASRKGVLPCTGCREAAAAALARRRRASRQANETSEGECA